MKYIFSALHYRRWRLTSQPVLVGFVILPVGGVLCVTTLDEVSILKNAEKADVIEPKRVGIAARVFARRLLASGPKTSMDLLDFDQKEVSQIRMTRPRLISDE